MAKGRLQSLSDVLIFDEFLEALYFRLEQDGNILSQERVEEYAGMAMTDTGCVAS